MPNFVLTLPLKTELFQDDILDKKFEECRKIYNSCVGELYKRYNHMRESKQYQKVSKMPTGKDRNKLFNELNKQWGLTEYSLHIFVKLMNKHFNIDAMTGQTIATRAFDAFQGVMFHTASKIKYKAYGELNSIEGKTNKQGIRYRDGVLFYNKLSIPAIIKNNDIYAHRALENPIKYCRIKREMIKGKYHYYVQLILDGTPPIKYDKETGEIKHGIGEGVVGIDIGTQTIAYASDKKVKLLELCPEVVKLDKEMKLLQRKMDRSRRVTNPNKFNSNGTIKKGNRDKWIYSKHYIKIKNHRKELYRKQSAIRKQSHNMLANEILKLGNKFYVENMSYKGLQKRAKKTTINETTGRINKKKRFGKSLANKAPAMFLTILDNKLKWNDTQLNKIDTYSVKASQYNHITAECIKKELNERWNIFNIDGEAIKIQRDLYSAFLIMNVKSNLKEIDRELCISKFNSFQELHNKEIYRIRNNSNKLISSMGI